MAVVTGLAVLAPVASVGYAAHAAISSVRDEAKAAVLAVRQEVADVRLAERAHESKDDERVDDIRRRLSSLESRR